MTSPPTTLPRSGPAAGLTGGFWGLKSESSDMIHLDLMRFIASAAIVFHHSHEFLAPVADRAALGRRSYGLALFVDLFFLISGYVITRVYSHRVTEFPQILLFFQRRIGRLVPLHWLTLGLSAILWAGILSLNRQETHAPNFSGTCMFQTMFLVQAWASCRNQSLLNGVTWSISAEMVLYALFPLVALIGNRVRILLPIIGVACLLWASDNARSYGFAAYDWTAIHAVVRALPAFVFGACLHFWAPALKYVPSPAAILFPALVVLITAMLTGVSWPVQLGLVYCVGTLAVAADLRGQASAWVVRMAPLGQLTYSIYMWHGLFILVFLNIAGDKLLHLGRGPMLLLLTVCYGTIFIWSYLSFVVIETPARRWVDSWFSGR